MTDATTAIEKPASQMRAIWQQFRTHKGALFGLIVLGTLILAVVLGPFLWVPEKMSVAGHRHLFRHPQKRPQNHGQNQRAQHNQPKQSALMGAKLLPNRPHLAGGFFNRCGGVSHSGSSGREGRKARRRSG